MDIKIASRKRRLFAWLLDGFFLALIELCFLIPFLMSVFQGNETARPNSWLITYMGTAVIALIVIYMSRDCFKGVSPGKYILGLAVRDDHDHSRIPSCGRLFARNLPLFVWPVEALVLLFNSESRRLGDLWTNSVVVQVAKAKKLYLLLGVPLGIAILMGGISFGIKNSDAYQAATQFLMTNQQVKDQVGDIENFGEFPSGSIQINNGYGNAVIGVSIHGTRKDAKAQVLLAKEPGAFWTVKDFRIR